MGSEACGYIAVLDTETNFDDEVISIGVVAARVPDLRPADRLYLILEPECFKPSMFGSSLMHARAAVDARLPRCEAIRLVRDFLDRYGIEHLFAYNAPFDRMHLPELWDRRWYDILRLAAYRQYNPAIPEDCPCCGSGRMKRGYCAENIYRMLTGKDSYREIHNALTDAEDELEIMRCLGHPLRVYERTEIGSAFCSGGE